MTGILASIAFRNVLRHGKRTLITALVLTVGLGMFIFFDSLLAGMDRMTIDSMTDYTESSLKVMTPGYRREMRATPLDFGIGNPEGAMERIARAVPETEAIAPRTAFIGYASNRTDSLPVLGTAVDPKRDAAVFKLAERVAQGRWLSPEAAENEIVLGKALAADLGLGVGDWLVLSARAANDTLNADEFKIAGILDVPAQEVAQSGVYLSYQAAKALLGEELPVTTIAVALPKRATLDAELAESEKAAAAAKQAIPGIDAIPIAERPRTTWPCAP